MSIQVSALEGVNFGNRIIAKEPSGIFHKFLYELCLVRDQVQIESGTGRCNLVVSNTHRLVFFGQSVNNPEINIEHIEGRMAMITFPKDILDKATVVYY